MSRRLAPFAAALLAMFAPVAAADELLNVGDPAPKFEVKEFVKGEPVKSLEKGKTYVVEFWATWCGPCRTSIPHLTELQKKYKDVTFVGVSAFEQDQDEVKPFVKEMGDKMDYRVAIDAVPEGASPQDGKMASAWMEAAREQGIPSAFVINGDGVIAWIGHPMNLEAPLEKILDGQWDLKAAAGERRATKDRELKIEKLKGKLIAAQQSGDPKRLLKVIDAAIEDDPGLEPALGPQKFVVLLKADGKKALEYGRHLIDEALKDEPQALNFVAWMVVDPEKEKPDAKLAQLALKAALRADELEDGKEAAIADTLGRAYFVNGDLVKAVEVQERALQLSRGTPTEDEMKQRLQEYQKAAEKAADKK